jgi:hypothetical protein
MANRITWTESKRKFLYDYLVEKYGSHKTWENRYYPQNKEQFRQDLILLQSIFGGGGDDNDGRAVKMQIEFAITSFKDGARWSDQWRNYILNKAAAYNAGFIGHDLLVPEKDED